MEAGFGLRTCPVRTQAAGSAAKGRQGGASRLEWYTAPRRTEPCKYVRIRVTGTSTSAHGTEAESVLQIEVIVTDLSRQISMRLHLLSQ